MIPPYQDCTAELLGRISGSRLNFGNLFVVTDGVERNVDQPVIGVQGSENRERMIGGVFLDGKLGIGNELYDRNALLFETLLDLSLGQSLARHDGLGSLRFSKPRGHYPDDEFVLAFGFFFPVGVRR